MSNKYSGFVWILSSISLIIYGILAYVDQSLPGVERVVSYMSTVSGVYIYGAAFLAILIEGVYIVGSFFPGASLVVILAILSQVGGVPTFLFTILVIFLGWSIAGVINIFLAKIYHTKILKKVHDPDYVVLGKPWATWFPSFRANYEVAQVVEGGKVYDVLLSSLKVKLIISIIMMGIVAAIPLVVDIHDISNEKGFTTLLIIAAISFTVGVVKIRKSSKKTSL